LLSGAIPVQVAETPALPWPLTQIFMFYRIKIKLIKVKYKDRIVQALRPYLNDRELLLYLACFERGLMGKGYIIGAYNASVILPTQNGEAIRNNNISLDKMLIETAKYYKLLKAIKNERKLKKGNF
jgi:hypothetical protein